MMFVAENVGYFKGNQTIHFLSSSVSTPSRNGGKCTVTTFSLAFSGRSPECLLLFRWALHSSVTRFHLTFVVMKESLTLGFGALRPFFKDLSQSQVTPSHTFSNPSCLLGANICRATNFINSASNFLPLIHGFESQISWNTSYRHFQYLVSLA